MIASTFAAYDRPARWLLLGSLALNLFFIGMAIAFAVKYSPQPVQVTVERPRTAAARIERVAVTLPPADADKLRSAFQARAAAAEATRQEFERAVDKIRASLRAEPFDPAALRVAMAETRTARAGAEQVTQDIFAAAAAEMSPQGRNSLADWNSPARSQAAR